MKSQSARLPLAHPTLAQTGLIWLQRLVAVACLGFGVFYWVRLIGIYDDPTWRFDTMPVYWRGVSVALAAFYPFAAIGLWTLASWGPVVWLICALIEVTMYLGFPNLFGTNLEIVAAHGAVALLYCILYGVTRWQKRKPS